MAEKKTITIKTLRLARVRCDKDHKDPWLRRLYLLWATVNPDGTRGSQYQLAQTDENGYLSVPDNELDPHPEAVQPLLAEIDYFFYFIRHPGVDLPTKILDDVNSDSKKWGDPKKYQLKKEETGKDKQKKAITEIILRIPEDPLVFTPVGSDFYQKWVLFRGMPGIGDGILDTDIQCPPLLEQVRRLQYQLGALRYWVGTHTHPYFPQAFNKKKKIFEPNEGVFEETTWNSVLLFQRHAEEGKVIKLDPSVQRLPLVTPGSFDPTPDASNSKTQIREAVNYVAGTEFNMPPVRIEYKTVVDKVTGDTIKKWLESGVRKPGSVLISHGGDETWMNSFALSDFSKWSNKLKELGFKQGIEVSNVLRDPRIGVVTGGGMITTSIHKSGFALDLTMAWSKGKIEGKYTYPLYFERDPSETKKIRWIVYAQVNEKDLPASLLPQVDGIGVITGYRSSTEPYVEYKRTIANFVYDGESEAGGQGVALSIPDSWFLNVTSVANNFGFTRIGPHATGWQLATPAATLTISDAASLAAVVARLEKHLGQLADSKLRLVNKTVTINSKTSLEIPDCKTAIKNLREWLNIAIKHEATPEVHIVPTEKQGKNLIDRLKKSKSLFGNSKFVRVD